MVAAAATMLTVLVVAGAAPALACNGPKPAGALYVSPTGSSGAVGKNCGTASFSSIGAGVAAAPAGGTVIVCPGTSQRT